MSLDISAYTGIMKLDAILDENGKAINAKSGEAVESNWFTAWLNPEFPGRADDIVDGAVYSYTNGTGFRVGYAGHFWWRNSLAEIADYPEGGLMNFNRVETCYFGGAIAAGSGPFYELINFSDSEGIIGTDVSKKLAADFAKFDKQAASVGGPFYETYLKWTEAFKMASNQGCVRFH